MRKSLRQKRRTHGLKTSWMMPVLMMFVIPALAYGYFLQAEWWLDNRHLPKILEAIEADVTLSVAQEDAMIRLLKTTPLSQLAAEQPPQFDVGPTLRDRYYLFLQLKRLAFWSLISGTVVTVIAGVCVVLAGVSPRAQYVGMKFGWNLLRLYCAVQFVALGILLVSISFWLSYLWYEVYEKKLMLSIGGGAVLVVGGMLIALVLPSRFRVMASGIVLRPKTAPELWLHLKMLCDALQTRTPDQVLIGVEQGIFVTEFPVTATKENVYRGRTLYLSLLHLKQLREGEVNAVVAHELAHFSRRDAFASRRLGPLWRRYNAALQNQYQTMVPLPANELLLTFKELCAIAAGRMRRQRESRADASAAAATSHDDLARGLLRVAAFTSYYDSAVKPLFEQANPSPPGDLESRINREFAEFLPGFLQDPATSKFKIPHPLDNHASLGDRFQEMGIDMADAVRATLTKPGDGAWRKHLPRSEQLERQLWTSYQQRLGNAQEELLVYQYLPQTPDEQVLVEKWFPEIQFDSPYGTLCIDFEKIIDTDWPDSVRLRELLAVGLDDSNMLEIQFRRADRKYRTIDTKRFEELDRDQLIDDIKRYWRRAQVSERYQMEETGELYSKDPDYLQNEPLE